MLPALIVESDRRLQAMDRWKAGFCLLGSLFAYGFTILLLLEDLWHSYAEKLCVVTNSTVAEGRCCSKYQRRPKFDAVWFLNVRSNGFNSTHYLADMRQAFTHYYEADEAIRKTHLVSYHFVPTGSRNLILLRLALSIVATCTQKISTLYAGRNHRTKESHPQYSASARYSFS